MRALFLVLLALPIALDAQGRRTAPATRATERPGSARTIAGRDPLVIRAEYAAVLLQAERYEEAGHEYRVLLDADSTNQAWRLGLARAYAWGDRPRDAERELLRLRAEPRTDPAVEALLRAARGSMRPSPQEAAAWLAEDSGYAPYRLALARALVRTRRASAALAHFDALLASDPDAALMREAGAAYFAAGDTVAGIRLVNASLAREASVEGYLILGHLHRARGDSAGGRAAYEAARTVGPDDPAVATALAHLAREARPRMTVAGTPMDAAGWLARSDAVGDNTGMSYATLAIRRGGLIGEALGGTLRMGGGAELRRMEERGVAAPAHGVATDAAVEWERWYGATGGRLMIRGGIALHERMSVAPIGAVAAAVWVNAWELSFELETAPAYPELLTMASLREPDPRGGGPLSADRMSAAIAGPLGRADFALAIERTDLADGNRRSTVQGDVRYAWRDRLSVLYSMSTVQADDWSALYWSPETFMSHGVGLELAQDRRRGLSYRARALAGAALAEEIIDTSPGSGFAGELTRTVAPQLSASGELAWRRNAWELAAGAGYGRGRSGGYERASATVVLRFVPER